MNPRELTTVHEQAALPLVAWLDVLSAVLPPRGILVVGAGNGTGPWVQWLVRHSVGTVWLIEGDETQYRHLRNHVPANVDWVLRRNVVAATADVTTFYTASNPAEGGLIAPERLRSLWPHLEMGGTSREVNAVTLDSLWFEGAQIFNWLIVDCLPAATLLQGGVHLLAQADVVVVRVITDERLDESLGAGHLGIERLLTSSGFKCVQLWRERHPALAHALYVRNVGLQGQQLNQARIAAEKLRCELRIAVENAQKESSEQSIKFMNLHAQSEKERTEALSKCLRYEAHIRDLEQSLYVASERANREVETLKSISETATNMHSCVDRLEAGLQRAGAYIEENAGAIRELCVESREQWASVGRTLENVVRESLGTELHRLLKREADNVVKQLEAFLKIQSFMRDGLVTPTMHGWPISADFAETLIKVVRNNKYDAVVEFGSGTSTALISHALMKQEVNEPRVRAMKHIAFEHSDRFFEKTKMLVSDVCGDAGKVDLVLAPLVDYTDKSGAYRFYNVERLAGLSAALYDESECPSLLIVVDGPPGSTCRNARYPALPSVLTCFPQCNLTILLDDYDREEERAIVAMWRVLLDEFGCEYSETILPLEKGAVMMNVAVRISQ